jgi:hypothetical protein
MALVKLKIFSILILLAFTVKFQAQISHGGKPFPYDPVKSPAPKIILKDFDIDKALFRSLSEDAAKGKKPFEFAWNHEVDLSPENSGVWTIREGGIKTWRVEIISSGAYAVNVYFGVYRLNKGCTLFAYTPDQSRILGGFNEKNNAPDGPLALAFVPGQSVVLELQVPGDVQDYGEISVNSIGHDFINVFGRKNISDQYYGRSDYCNVDVICPEGKDWEVVKRAVCRIAIKNGPSTTLCSGSLINTTHNDSRPYLLTANHCINTSTKAGNSVFYFDYESESCNGPDDTTTVYTLSGSQILASSDSLDFTLLRLSSDVPGSYNPYYAGWSRSPLPATSVSCIHHPEGDVKKISIEEHSVTSEYQVVNTPDWLVTESLPDGFWRILHWEVGTTEGGSSGAPIFNQKQKIVGNLTGGDATCSLPINDYFFKFYMGWDYYPDPGRQLKYWLDSLNTGVIELNGSEPIPGDSVDYAERYILYPNPANEYVIFETDSLEIIGGTITILTLDGRAILNYTIQDEKSIILNIGTLNEGMFLFNYRNQNLRITRKLLIIH